ncbi:hypothetical protein CsSME_00039487 [Camellia sinensis var. sinensis]
MLLQHHSTPKSPKTQNRTLPTLRSQPSNSSAWVSNSLYRIVGIRFLKSIGIRSNPSSIIRPLSQIFDSNDGSRCLWNYPSDSLLNLAKIKGWQSDCNGEFKDAPRLKPQRRTTIFLSLEQTSSIRFRVIE